MEQEPFKVGSGTGVNVLSSAINKRLSSEPVIVLRCIGAGAVNQAMKAIAKSSRKSYAERQQALSVQAKFLQLENQVNCLDLAITLGNAFF